MKGKADSPSREGLKGIEKSGQQWPLFPRKVHCCLWGYKDLELALYSSRIKNLNSITD